MQHNSSPDWEPMSQLCSQNACSLALPSPYSMNVGNACSSVLAVEPDGPRHCPIRRARKQHGDIVDRQVDADLPKNDRPRPAVTPAWITGALFALATGSATGLFRSLGTGRISHSPQATFHAETGQKIHLMIFNLALLLA
ncbi:hypothetical protein ACWD4G_37350 [Streptomyces sp. NPDC002643]